MIIQIELPSAALVRGRIEEAYAKWNKNLIAYEDWQRQEREAKAKRTNAEADLSQALNEGYRVIERYPFSIGDGLHLVLYKPDTEPVPDETFIKTTTLPEHRQTILRNAGYPVVCNKCGAYHGDDWDCVLQIGQQELKP